MQQFIQEKWGHSMSEEYILKTAFSEPTMIDRIFLSLLVLSKKWHIQAHFQVIYMSALVKTVLHMAQYSRYRPPVQGVTAGLGGLWVLYCGFAGFCFIFIMCLYFTLVFYKLSLCQKCMCVYIYILLKICLSFIRLCPLTPKVQYFEFFFSFPSFSFTNMLVTIVLINLGRSPLYKLEAGKWGCNFVSHL